MGKTTKIEWCDHTFNSWRGCQKVAAGCANCYADAQAKRNTGTLGVWGPNGTRVVAAELAWKQIEKWDREAAQAGESRSVFCGSMCDVFEDWPGDVRDSLGNVVNPRTWKPIESEGPAPATLTDVRQRLFRLIDATPNLTWLLLTKRIENARPVWPTRDARPMRLDNVYLGTSIACQEDAERNIPELLKCRDLCRGVFLSIEPPLGDVQLVDIEAKGGWRIDALRGEWRRWHHDHESGDSEELHDGGPRIDQVIVGGESGPHARPCDIAWVRSIVRQCEAAGVKCFVKQLGANIIGSEKELHEMRNICIDRRPGTDAMVLWPFHDKKGGDPAEWPDDLRVRNLIWKGGA